MHNNAKSKDWTTLVVFESKEENSLVCEIIKVLSMVDEITLRLLAILN